MDGVKLIVLICLVMALGQLLMGCATVKETNGFAFMPEEKELLDMERDDFDIKILGAPDAEVLRCRARSIPLEVDFKTIHDRMENTMRRALGVGIAGPQVGLYLRVAVLMLDYVTDSPRVIFVRNPVILKRSHEMAEGFEGCLSVPNAGGVVNRYKRISVEYYNEQNERVVGEYEGPNAVLWQHELDHLDGVLYVDKVKGELMTAEEMQKKREEEND